MKQEIITVAKNIYLEKGINDTNLNDIAQVLNTSRRTIYRHFPSKEALLFEVVAAILEEWNLTSSTIYTNLVGNKLCQLEIFLYSLVKEMDLNFQYLKFLAEFDFYCGDNFIDDYQNNVYNHFNQSLFAIEDYILQLINEGIAEGSITANSNPKLIVATISTMLWSFSQKCSYRKKTIAIETGFSHHQIINQQIKIYITSLKGV